MPIDALDHRLDQDCKGMCDLFQLLVEGVLREIVVQVICGAP
jgi:hypothetical protein